MWQFDLVTLPSLDSQNNSLIDVKNRLDKIVGEFKSGKKDPTCENELKEFKAHYDQYTEAVDTKLLDIRAQMGEILQNLSNEIESLNNFNDSESQRVINKFKNSPNKDISSMGRIQLTTRQVVLNLQKINALKPKKDKIDSKITTFDQNISLLLTLIPSAGLYSQLYQNLESYLLNSDVTETKKLKILTKAIANITQSHRSTNIINKMYENNPLSFYQDQLVEMIKNYPSQNLEQGRDIIEIAKDTGNYFKELTITAGNLFNYLSQIVKFSYTLYAGKLPPINSDDLETEKEKYLQLTEQALFNAREERFGPNPFRLTDYIKLHLERLVEIENLLGKKHRTIADEAEARIASNSTEALRATAMMYKELNDSESSKKSIIKKGVASSLSS